ncbi:MAG: hypothetical protein HY922_15425 [Elusimicrobia bacterium]|nr:hypothetical protein [Elusimicrobiota bacterium]
MTMMKAGLGAWMFAGLLSALPACGHADSALGQERDAHGSRIVTLLAGSHVDEDPAAPALLLLKQGMENPDFVSTDLVTYIRGEERSLLGRREVITEETSTSILYRGSRQYRFQTTVKIDAETGRELEDTKRSDS